MSPVEALLEPVDEVVPGIDLPGAAILTGTSSAAERLRAEIHAAADATCVLIVADAGGVPVDVARQIHTASRRAGPFLYVDCASAEPAAIVRELFGAVSADVTAELEVVDAMSALAGARGGSLYLANLAELSATAQARLARVARDGEVHVAGEGSRPLDARLLASLSSAAGGPALRADLLRHLGRVRVVLPSLRRLGTLKDARERFERDYIAAVIEHHRGRIAAAAQTLGIQRTNLYRKARQLGIDVARKGQRA